MHFADLNEYGRSEYFWVDKNGAVTAFLILVSSSGSANAGKVQWSAQRTNAPGVGSNRARVWFENLKGDGGPTTIR